MDLLTNKRIDEFGTLRGSVNPYMFADLAKILETYPEEERNKVFEMDIEDIKNGYLTKSFTGFVMRMCSFIDLQDEITDFTVLNNVYLLLFNKRFEILGDQLLNAVYNASHLLENNSMKDIEINLTEFATNMLMQGDFLSSTILTKLGLNTYMSLQRYKEVVLDAELLANDSYVDNIISLVNRKFDKDVYLETINK